MPLEQPESSTALVNHESEEKKGLSWLDAAYWISSNIALLLIRAPEVEEGGSFSNEGELSDSSDLVPSESISFETISGQKYRLARVVLSPLSHQSVINIRIEGRKGGLRVATSELKQSGCDYQEFMLRGLSGARDTDRRRIMEFLASTSQELEQSTGLIPSCQALRQFREGLRDRFSLARIDKSVSRGLHVDLLLRIDEKSFYLRGWVLDRQAPVRSLRVLSPEGSDRELRERAFTYGRPDVDQFYGISSPEHSQASGFISFFELNTPSFLEEEWILQMENDVGEGVETLATITPADLPTIRRTILEDLVHSTGGVRLLREHAYPAITRLQKKEETTFGIQDIQQYGTPQDTPEVSVIVPLYGRIDFVEHQLAQFFRDSEICESDLIYVLDSPELADSLRENALQLAQLYQVPFRIVNLRRNSGFSAANNFGAQLARGRKLLFLNSDVLPDMPGWLGRMSSFYDSIDKIGALGPKLLYEDNSVQHAGIYFRREAASGLWENMHYYKGLHRELDIVNHSRIVPAVTGACLMIARHLFDEIGGFRSLYVQGDFEDTDLCLRLNSEGFSNWYFSEVELYHLEGQSYPGPLRHLVNRYNRWLHTYFWNEDIEALMAGTSKPTSSGEPWISTLESGVSLAKEQRL